MPTPRQAVTLRFIAGYIGEHGYAPVGREIAAATGVSRQFAQRVVRRLVATGYLRETGESVRGLEVVKMIGPAEPRV